ncbi:unnamed protein product [Onchocerca flexuosa]|uniref:Coiled-coil domain-containing protein 22 homolog n=1 Tax=Onchocerca flexuosa TaxID=387005 RepID=A0A183HYW1_9BILA|nr:unnamed protein product [Onchocerca flexuosa]
MDVVDGQIINTLCHLDPFVFPSANLFCFCKKRQCVKWNCCFDFRNFFDGLHEIPNSIAELDTATFYRAIVTLAWSCKQSTRKEIPSKILPQNMSAKFRCITTVVNASIGVRDPIDYHMLLYGRSKELRNILIGLMEKLSKDSPVVTSVDDPLADLIRSVNRGEDDNKECLTRYNSSQKEAWALSTRVDFIGFCGDVMAALHYNDWRYRQSAFVCSLLENNAMNNNNTAQNCRSVQDEIPATLHLRYPSINKQMKPKLKSKPILSPELQKKRKTKDEQEINEVSKMDVEKSEIFDKLLDEVMALTTYVDSKKISENKMQNDEAERLLTLQSRKLREAEIDERLKKLLENPDALLKLESYIDGSNERMQHLQNLWLRAKAEKDEEVKAARLAALSSDFTLPYRNRETSAKDTKLVENELAGRKKTLEKLVCFRLY